MQKYKLRSLVCVNIKKQLMKTLLLFVADYFLLF